jgi:hypothetical protein
MASGVDGSRGVSVAVGVGGDVVVGTVALATHPTTTTASKSVIPHPDLLVLVLICIIY